MNRALQQARLPWEEPRPLFWGIIIALSVGIIGGSATPLTEWYFNLTVPSWKPPDWAFGPAWTTIFILSTFAGVKSWRASRRQQRKRVLTLYLVNGALNILWSLLFFTAQRPDLALFEIPFLWASIAAMVVAARPAGRIAQAALMPYLIWVSFAGVLNWSIASLNGYL